MGASGTEVPAAVFSEDAACAGREPGKAVSEPSLSSFSVALEAVAVSAFVFVSKGTVERERERGSLGHIAILLPSKCCFTDNWGWWHDGIPEVIFPCGAFSSDFFRKKEGVVASWRNPVCGPAKWLQGSYFSLFILVFPILL